MALLNPTDLKAQLEWDFATMKFEGVFLAKYFVQIMLCETEAGEVYSLTIYKHEDELMASDGLQSAVDGEVVMNLAFDVDLQSSPLSQEADLVAYAMRACYLGL